MSFIKSNQFESIYSNFNAPISSINCGDKCAPYNENLIPFCCDIKHAVPSAYDTEWIYLQENTDLWHEWKNENAEDENKLNTEKPENQILVECKGHLECQREFRTITCRSFPFFPYIDKTGTFLGLSYYWTYMNRCWVISNMQVISKEYLDEFITTFDHLFAINPSEKENFKYHSMIMRRVFGRWHKQIALLHRNGNYFLITPRSGYLSLIEPNELEKFDPYNLTHELPFPDEVA